MPTRHRIATVEEFPEDGSRVLTEIDGVEVGVFRIDGGFHAILNLCVHQGGPLCEGELRGQYGVDDDGWEWTFDPVEQNVVCPWHGWKYDVTTGRNIDDDRYTVPTFVVEVEDGVVYVVR